MTWLLLGVAIAVAATDWAAVQLGYRRLEAAAKPAVMVVLILAALAAGDAESSVRWLVVGGLVFGLIGDVLLLPAVDVFIGGLASFLIGHLLYTVAFVSAGVGLAWALPGLAVAVAMLALAGNKILAAVRTSRLAIPVAAYILTITAMLVAAWATGSWWFGLGATVFAASDALLGHDRFVTPRVDRRVVVHILYHGGQAALVAGLTTL